MAIGERRLQDRTRLNSKYNEEKWEFIAKLHFGEGAQWMKNDSQKARGIGLWLSQSNKILAAGRARPSDITWGMVEEEEFGQVLLVIRYQGCQILAKTGPLEHTPNDRAKSSSEGPDQSLVKEGIFVSLSSYSYFLCTI